MKRECGECQACCKILPISEIGKKAGVRCDNQKFGVGCKVHGTPAQPGSCKRWNCWWLLDPTCDLSRPDRAGYVIDPSPDFVILGDDVFAGRKVAALQIWCDEKRRDAWTGARVWIEKMLKGKDAVILVRYGSKEAMAVIPPWMSDTQEWQIQPSRMMHGLIANNVRAQMIGQRLAEIAGQKDVSQ
jgi:hypothetical protein